MENIIYDTEEKQRERENDFILNPQRLDLLNKIQTEIVTEIIERLKEDKYMSIYKDKHTTTIEFDEYYYWEYAICTERVTIWNGDCNGVDYVSFYGDSMELIPREIPKELKPVLWETILNALSAQKANLPYKEFLKQKDDAVVVQAEITKKNEIEEARKILQKHNAL